VPIENHKQLFQESLDLKMRMTAYWKIVLRRFVDWMALHLRFSMHDLVNREMEKEIGSELIGPTGSGRISRMLEEVPEVAAKREKLNRSIKLLRSLRRWWPRSWTGLLLMVTPIINQCCCSSGLFLF